MKIQLLAVLVLACCLTSCTCTRILLDSTETTTVWHAEGVRSTWLQVGLVKFLPTTVSKDSCRYEIGISKYMAVTQKKFIVGVWHDHVDTLRLNN